MITTPEQIKAARALLRIEQDDLARRAKVSVVTIRRLETPLGGARVAARTLEGVRSILEQAGAEFIPNGVRRRTPDPLGREARFQELLSISKESAELLRGHTIFTDDDLYGDDGLPK
jgi:transcriptional regulator with XRE-family HTH domain